MDIIISSVAILTLTSLSWLVFRIHFFIIIQIKETGKVD